MTSPWVARATANRLPASDRTGVIERREINRADAIDAPAARITISGGTYTVADLQRAMARETER
jgi:hypothetical protein